jgi:transglutaminase-like putative cysteine protease
MVPTPGDRPMNDVLRGPRSWLASALCAAGVSASLFALSSLIQPGRWLGAGVLAVVGLAAVLAATRYTTRAWWTPTVVGALAGTVGLLIAYAAPHGRLQLIPDRESVARLGDLLRAGLQAADASRPPADATVPLEVLVVAGAMLVILAVDLIAVGLGAPAWSGLALLALWIPPLIIGRPAGTPAFLGTSLAYLLLLAVTAVPNRPTRRTASAEERRRRVSAAVGASGVVTVVALLLGPVGSVLPGWSSVRLPDVGTSTGGSLQLAEDLDMRQSLGTRSTEVVLTYRAEPVAAGPLRLFTLRDYDGERWAREADVVDDLPSAPEDSFLWPVRDLTPEPPGEGDPGITRLDVRLEGLRESRLPVPVMPRSVEVGGDLAYDSRRDEVVRPRPTTRGLEYSMDVQLLGLTDDVLRRSGEDDPRDVAEYLAVPQTSHTGEVVQVAEEVTAGLDSRYDQALALQSYLRNAQNFTYTTDVDPARSDDAVWDFLGSRTGYCVQFATAMTVMARTLDIPARLAVGFLPGERDEDTGQFVVTGRQSHAWPELYFPDAGWVRFEPTPAIQSGAPPTWADPFANTGPTVPEEAEPTAAAPTGGPVPTSAPAPQAGTAGSASSPADYVVPVGAGLGVLLLALGAYLLRGRLNRSEELRPEVAWAHLRSRLAGSGIVWSDSHTPRQAAALVTAEVENRKDGPMAPEARAALRDLARAVEDHRYAVNPRVWEHAELEQRVATVLREATRPAAAGTRAG